jgi:putative peptidoglycan lipid II flippase
MSLFRSIATIGGLTAVSRIFGFVRDTLIAAFLGAGPVADAFFVALRFPNLFRSLFAEGAFSAAFVPIFVGVLHEEGRARAIAFAEDTLAVLTTALFVFVLAVEVTMPWVMMALAPGFIGGPSFAYAVEFSRITFPYLLFISLTALQGGVLNALGRFAAPAATPILLNLSLIAALLGSGRWMPTLGHALAWGLVLAGILQFLWLLGSCAGAGVSLRLPRPRLTGKVRQLLRRALPVALGAGIYQVNVMAGTVLASFLPAGSVSYLFYADRLSQLPYGIIGVAVSTALLPVLARQVKVRDEPAALHSQNRAIEFACLLMLPAAVALIALAEPLIAVLFERGAFDRHAVHQTAAALMAFAAGLPAFMLIKALTPNFFARGDTATPVRIAAVAAALNVAMSVALMFPLAHVGIALATSLAAWINAGLLAVVLYRRGLLKADRRLRRRLPRTCGATAVMLAVVLAADHALGDWLARPFLQQAPLLASIITGGLAAYALAAQLFGAATLADLKSMLRRNPAA